MKRLLEPEKGYMILKKQDWHTQELSEAVAGHTGSDEVSALRGKADINLHPNQEAIAN